MAYASGALLYHQRRGRGVMVSDLFGKPPWRFVAYQRFNWQATRQFSQFIGYLFFLHWIFIKLAEKMLARCGIGDGSFTRSTKLRENTMSLVILVISKLPKARRGRAWKVFWYAYYILTDHMDAFVVDYCEAWSQQPSFDAEIVLFVENGHRIAIPCSSTADDKDLVRHLRTFYDLILANGGLSEFLGLKSSTRIDIVEIEQEFAVGNRAGPPLDLGRYGPYNRQIHYFRDPSQLTGTKIRDRLLKESVLGHRGTQQRGINIVRTWNPRAASTTVLIPVMISFCISVVWSIVASVHFKADVQSSTQTGFTIGSYVVTAGALLIALVAFLDTKYNASEEMTTQAWPTTSPPQHVQQASGAQQQLNTQVNQQVTP